ncbi:uncharacterized protein F4822DRAFT_439325 [Hypoxylon trugodes]|uniref:uncharacterized protein n=1 Tax=Hypoxylon trugodes TaxID=326681 RepID=UPI00219F5D41|nr:uncharacterized protein F4822DRAFT_439325 [Hypoxylon trugodes]KAI1393117.1 hypothetical protein F4822DRAFT_439325 [Hypoxylon trugodes]
MEASALTQVVKPLYSFLFPDHDANGPRLNNESSEHGKCQDISADKSITRYLLERSADFRELTELRRKGWENPEGDVYFRNQRRNADNCDDQTAQHFFRMMMKIGEEIHQSTNAFAIRSREPRILDMCMAPGGFLATALKHNPGAKGLAFSLPPSSGGHRVLIQNSSAVEQRFLDITMLAADMGVEEIPKDHPDAGNFLSQQLRPNQLFDLALCDGQVLRTHERSEYREKRESRRLTVVQLALSLEYLRPGGAMVVLLHRLEAWDTADLLRAFCKFATVRTLKPTTSHTRRSSFYMVATRIQSRHPEAIRLVESWKNIWKIATFGSDEDYQRALRNDSSNAEKLLEEFGPRLERSGSRIWKVQSNALAKAPWCKDRK